MRMYLPFHRPVAYRRAFGKWLAGIGLAAAVVTAPALWRPVHAAELATPIAATDAYFQTVAGNRENFGMYPQFHGGGHGGFHPGGHHEIRHRFDEHRHHFRDGFLDCPPWDSRNLPHPPYGYEYCW